MSTSSGATCATSFNGVSAIGARVESSGVCWEHAHPDWLNVYDATYWSGVGVHKGNENFALDRNPIAAFAKAGGTTLSFPASHSMERWSKSRRNFALLGNPGTGKVSAHIPIP